MKNTPVICGPTASGKTSLALQVADALLHRHSGPCLASPETLEKSPEDSNRSRQVDPESIPSGVNILSADSRQIFRGLDIVTGKDIPSDLPSNIKFFGIDLVDASEKFNLSDFTDYAHTVIQKSLEENIPLIIVGGTGLYLKAITSNLLTVNVPPDPKLRTKLEKLDLSALKKKLLEINPKKFASLNNSDANNPRRLIRAIEISSSKKAHPTQHRHSGLDPESIQISPPTFHWLGLRQDKEVQKACIRQRVFDRLDNGALDEVKKLIKKYPDQNLPLFSSLGVKQIVEYLGKKISREELIDQWTASEVDYSRRQMVWFQKQPDIIWYDKSKVDKSLIEKLTQILK